MFIAKRNQDLMPSLLNDLLNWNSWNNFATDSSNPMPKMNVSETDADYELELCVPGLSKDDLSLSIDSENNLVVEMTKQEASEKAEEGRRYLRHEFSSLQFKQLLSLPENVKKEAITAKVENGILRISLPKFTEAEKQALMQHIAIS